MIRLAAGVAAAKAVGTLARTAGRGGGTSLPGKVLTRVEPHAIEQLASRLDRGSVVISRHQRQDDDGGDGRLDPRAHRRPARPQPRGREHGRRHRERARRRLAPRRPDADGDFGLFEVDEFWLGPVVEELEPRAMLLGNLFRDQLDRYGELETIADRWARSCDEPRRRSCSTPTTRSSPTSAATRRTPSTSASTTTRSRCRSSSTRPTPSTAAAAATPYDYTAIYLAHLGHYRCPNCGQQRPEPTVVATDVELRGIRSAAFTLRERRVELPLPGLYNVYNALGAAALTLSLGVDARRRRRRPPGRRARVRPRRDARPRPPDVDPAGQEPGRRQRGAAHARAGGQGARPARRAQRPHRRRPRRLAGSGTPTGSCSSAACAASPPPAPAPPSSRCG